MKNKFIFFLLYLFLSEIAFADQFIFETSKIEILNDGKKIKAEDGKAISQDQNLEIVAKNFEYQKDIDILYAEFGYALVNSKQLRIKFDEIKYDQKKSIIIAKKNVKINEIKKNILIETDSIFFNVKDNIISSSSNSKFKDNFNNSITTTNFNYNLKEGDLRVENAELKDFNNNIFLIKKAYLNTTSNKLLGKDISINLNNENFNIDNEPRLKGRSLTSKGNLTEISKGVFTTCKIRDGCPPWEISAEKIQHDSEKRIINYKNAWLKIYDVPVMYFPKFFHPDPTVKRRSGFLVPTIKNTANSNNYLSIPYFSAISLNKDITFTPRFYTDDKFLVQSEYRQVNKDSKHISDFSFFSQNSKSSKNHFFYDYRKNLNFSYFEESNLDIKIEKTSNDTYLKSNKLISSLINDYNVLKNNLRLNLYSDDLSIKSEFTIYENLDKNSSDRYEFILPRFDISKKFKNQTRLEGNFTFNSNNLIRNYETNIFEKYNINNLIFNSDPLISKKGFNNNYNFVIKNVNSDTQNSSSFKEDENFYLSGLFQFNSSLPLIKEINAYKKILKPKISLKISPENTKDLSSDNDHRIDVNNIFNLDRLSVGDTVEGGLSLAYGSDYTIFDNVKNREVFSLKLANNLRLNENKDLPQNNQLGEKTSNFFSEISYSPSRFLTTKYNLSTKNNLTDINYESFKATISLNNFVTTFDYLNENNSSNENSYLLNTTRFALNKKNNLIFSTRENKSSNLTEYYNLIYQYKIDCLAASIEYNKDYYDDRDVKPEESIFFKLTIIPFGESSTPNLKN